MNTQAARSSFPVRDDISAEAPWRWLAAGWADIWRNPLVSLGYGAAFVLIGFAITAGLWRLGLSAFIPVAAGAFAMVGPLMAVGLYEMSRRYEKGEAFTLRDIVAVKVASPIQILYIGFFIMFGLLVWARVAMLLYALFINGSYMPLSKFAEFAIGTPQGLSMLVIGSVLGAIIAFGIFAVTVFSVPLLMHRHTDVFEAVVRSVQVVLKNRAACLLWAWLIAIFVAVGLATAFVGLIVIFPLLGHATWHAYRDVFPRD